MHLIRLNQLTKKQKRLRKNLRHVYNRHNISKTKITVFRSSRHIYAVLCGPNGDPITQSSSLHPEFRTLKINKTAMATKVGESLAHKIKELNKLEEPMWFDRRGFKFHGRVKAIADALRLEGVKI